MPIVRYKLRQAKQFIMQNINKGISSGIDTYLLIRIMTSGTFGVVCEVKQLSTDKSCAMKIVYQDPKYYNREVDMLRIVDHPNLLKMHDHFYVNLKDGKFLCIITDLYQYTICNLISNDKIREGIVNDIFKTENKNLHVNLYDNIAMKEEENFMNGSIRTKKMFKEYFRQALSGLDYMHRKGICHRDIKPTNILIDNEKLVICDFGSAKILTKDEKNTIYICSRYYRAPENLMGLPNYDCAIDIWAIGLVFIEFIIGKPLFKGESDKDQLDKILRLVKDDFKYQKTNLEENNVIGIVRYLELLKVPDDLIQVFAKCIVISPSNRMSAHQLLDLQYFKT